MIVDYFGLDNDIAALEAQLAAAQPPRRPELLAALAWYLRQRDTARALALAGEAEALLVAAGQLDDTESQRIRARLEVTRGEAACLGGQLDVALGHVSAARQRFEAIGDCVGWGDALLISAEAWRIRSDAPRVLDACEAAAASYGRAQDTLRQRIVQAWQAWDAKVRQAPELESRWIPAMTHATAPEHPGLAALHERFWGSSQFDRRPGVAVVHYQRCYEFALCAGEARLALVSGVSLAACWNNLNDHAQALEWGERTLDLARRTGWPLALGGALLQLGSVLRGFGRHAAAREMLHEAVAVLTPFPESQQWSTVCYYLGDLSLELSENEEALRWYREAERVGGRPRNVLTSLRGQAQALSRLSRPDEAVAAIERALSLTQDPNLVTHALRAYAEIARRHHLPAPAGSTAASAPIHYLEAALAVGEQMAGFTARDNLLSELARDYEAAGDLKQALHHERRAAAARQVTHTQKATDLVTAMQVRHETERARAEAAYHQALAQAEAKRADAEAEANRAKSAFLSNMSHELRSPLNAMLGFTRLLLRDPALSSRREDLSIVMRSGEHLYALINQVLDISKIEAGRASLVETEFDLHALLEELREMFTVTARAKDVGLVVRCDAAVPQHVRTDAVKLRQVLINLLGNALKFTHAGQVELMVSAQAHTLGFTVTDTGVGIAAQELAQLGQAFVQARAGQRAAEGTGLGLAISRGFVELMGGELLLSSVQGQGTRVHFAIALQAVEPSAVSTSHAPARRVIGLAPGTPATRILAVDDRPDGRLLVMRLLGPLGFEVRDAADGEQALAVWREWSPQLVLMDMRMPVMDGREATRRIKSTEQGRSTVVIALTASSFEEERAQILAAGCDDFLRKPFQEEALLEMIARHLHVRYAVEDEGTPATGSEPDAERLAQLPQDLRAQLLAALHRLDVQAVEVAIEAVRTVDPECAAAIALLAKRFEYQRLQTLLT